MDHYHIWCGLKDGVKDTDFADRVNAYMRHLHDAGTIAGWTVTRRKLGLGPPQLPEWHIVVQVEDLAQLDRAFTHVAGRAGAVEGLHHAVNSLAKDPFFALYRDFPDPGRKRGGEKF